MTSDKMYKFMVIDDHPFIRDGIINFIMAHGCFELAGDFNDTREALNATLAKIPDVIILDLNLGGKDGGKACKALKERFTKCKIIAFTQYEGREKELMALGFDGYVIKSERDTLIDAVNAVLKGDKYYSLKNKIPATTFFQDDQPDAFLKIKQLTTREIEVAKYIKQDFSNREISERMHISEDTVKTHRKHIKKKLQAKTKHALYAILNDL